MTSLAQVFGARPKFTELEPLGVIDIGSNSVRLVVYEGAVRAATPLFNEKVLCGLGRSIASTGHLGEEAMERALEALRRFRTIARILKVKNLRAIATAAVREAQDGHDFISRAEKAAGTKIEILSGEKEAELAAHGIRMGFLERRRSCWRSRRRQPRDHRHLSQQPQRRRDAAARRPCASLTRRATRSTRRSPSWTRRSPASIGW